MTIKNRLLAILLTIIFFIFSAIASELLARNKNEQQINKSSTRYLSYILADEFRQTSQDLTRLCRTYVATGEEKYWQAYWQIVQWRNGEIKRPEYVDKALYRGERKKQSDIMKELNFSAQEFSLLAQANNNSNALVFYNRYTFDNEEESLYYLSLVAQKLTLNLAETKIGISGYVDKKGETLSFWNQFIPEENTIFNEIEATQLNALSTHRHFALHKQFACV